MKRSDLATAEVLATVRDYGCHAFEALAARYPVKVVRAALARDVHRGLIEYGVTLDRPWLTPSGRTYTSL